ncbi:hypothetical protein J3R30DRAFT_3406327 [Lentinula aciculospora]|uniref:Uncharacterized protein n=1 Tax=Lentinula aciculospora TaxID=153920 RepID=A0A9W9A5Y8_9AGAR|nr:hypothetical protein J3R30DRAFT_3406327 [Lentinula aciculospora]
MISRCQLGNWRVIDPKAKAIQYDKKSLLVSLALANIPPSVQILSYPDLFTISKLSVLTEFYLGIMSRYDPKVIPDSLSLEQEWSESFTFTINKFPPPQLPMPSEPPSNLTNIEKKKHEKKGRRVVAGILPAQLFIAKRHAARDNSYDGGAHILQKSYDPTSATTRSAMTTQAKQLAKRIVIGEVWTALVFKAVGILQRGLSVTLMYHYSVPPRYIYNSLLQSEGVMAPRAKNNLQGVVSMVVSSIRQDWVPVGGTESRRRNVRTIL